jgi:hypothetical protein
MPYHTVRTSGASDPCVLWLAGEMRGYAGPSGAKHLESSSRSTTRKVKPMKRRRPDLARKIAKLASDDLNLTYYTLNVLRTYVRIYLARSTTD